MRNEQMPPSKLGFGTLGMDVGTAGHLARLIFGSILVFFVVANLVPRISAGSGQWFASLLTYFALITLSYTLVYWILGELGVLQRLKPWYATTIFVGPAFLVAWWDFLVLPLTGIAIPSAFWFAMLAYIGLSFVLQWRLKYGGCEVVALPILLFRKRYPTYCIPLVALDAVEKAIVDNRIKLEGN